MAHTYTPGLQVLASGRIVDIDEHGKGTLQTCSWWVECQVPWANDPDFHADFPSDLYRVEECGASLFAIDGDVEAGWRCNAGHHHFTYGSARQQVEEREEALVEQYNNGREI